MNHYDRLVPKDSFLGRYLRYMAKLETAYDYDWWCGLWCLACACGRDTYVARPRTPVFLNMYLILIGDSGVPRKTTSVTTAGGLIRDLYRDHDDIGFLDAKVTAEKLDDMLHQRAIDHGSSRLAIAIPELAVFMGTEHYVANMPTLLTDLYDCPGYRHGGGTIARGEAIQCEVWLSFLSASTPVWLLKTVNPTVVEGGCTSRCIFVISNKPKQSIPWPEEGNSDEERKLLLRDLQLLKSRARKHGAIVLTPQAISAFRVWYGKRVRALDPYRQSFEAREDAHVLRIAALLSVNDQTWKVSAYHISKAVQLVSGVKDGSSLIFENTEARTKYAAALDSIRSSLISTGMDPIARSTLHHRTRIWVNTEQLNSILEVLHEIGAVQRFTHKTGERGRPVEYYRGTDILLAKGLGETVLEKFM
jgi:hypothetical protein